MARPSIFPGKIDGRRNRKFFEKNLRLAQKLRITKSNMATGVVLTLEVWELKIKNLLNRIWLIVVVSDILDIRS